MVNPAYRRYAYDDDLMALALRDGKTRVRVYRLSSSAIVLGSGSKAEQELDLGACLHHQVPILRRPGGGCSVLLDPGNVVVSVVTGGMPFGCHHQHFRILTDWLIAGLSHIGIHNVHQDGICDLVLNDRKVGGACLHRRGGLLYYSATLLVAPDMKMVDRLLAYPPREPEYRRGRSHHDFMGSLVPQRLQTVATAKTIARLLRESLDLPTLLHETEERREAVA